MGKDTQAGLARQMAVNPGSKPCLTRRLAMRHSDWHPAIVTNRPEQSWSVLETLRKRLVYLRDGDILHGAD